MELLEMKTILTNHFVINVVCAVVMAFLWRHNRKHFAGLTLWLLNYVLQAAALLLIALRGVAPDVLSIVIGNALVIAGTFLFYLGLERFVGKPGPQIQNYLLLAILVGVQTYFTFAQPNLKIRTLNVALGLLLFSAQGFWLLKRRVDAGLRPATRGVSHILAGYGLHSLVRSGITLWGPASSDFLESAALDTLLILAYQVLYLALTFSVFLMLNRRLFLELQAEQDALRASELRFRTVADFTYDWEYWLGPEQNLIYMSPSCERLTGYRADEFAARPDLLTHLVHPDDQAAWREHLQQYPNAKEGGLDVRIVRRDGELRWIAHVGQAVYDDQGHWLGRRSSNRDITARKRTETALQRHQEQLEALVAERTAALEQELADRKRVEEALWESEVRYRTLFESTYEGIVITGPDGKIISVNPAAVHMFGYENAADLIGMPGIELYQDPEQRKIIFTKLREQGYVVDYELLFKKKDGSKLNIKGSAVIHRDQQGDIVRTEGIFRDITERKRIEEALRQSEERYRTLVEASSDSIYVLDAEWRHLVVNQAATEFVRLSKAQLVGHKLTELFPGVEHTPFFQTFRTVMTTRRAAHMTDQYTFADGRQGWYEVMVAPVPEGLLCVSRDITERKQAEEALRASEEKFAKAFHANQVAMALTSLAEGRYLDVNAQFLRLAERTQDEVVGHTALELETWMDSGQRDQVIAALREHGAARDLEVTFRSKSGKLLTLLWSAERILLHHAPCILASAIDITARKQAEAALRESQARLMAMFNAIPDLIFRLDRQGVFLDYKADIADLYAQSEPTILGKRNRDLTPPEFADLIDRKIEETLQTGALQTFEYQLPMPGRGVRDYEARMVASGPDEVIAIVRDITDRKQAEAALRESEEIFRQFMQYSPIYIFIKDAQIRAVRLSQNYEQMLGRPLHELLGKTMDDLFPSDLAKSMMADDLKILHEGQALEVDEEFNGRYYTTIKFPIHIAGQPVYLAGFSLDITDRKRAEVALQEQFHFLQRLLDGIPVPIFYKDVQGVYRGCNTAFEQYLGVPKAAIIGKTVYDLAPRDLADMYEAADQALFRQGGLQTYEASVQYSDGTRRDVIFNKVTFVDANGVLAGLIGTMLDITARKQAERQLQRQAAILDTLLNSPQETVGLLDPQGNVLSVNRNGAKSFGLSPEELIGRNMYELLPEPTASARKTIVTEVMRTGQPAHFEDQRGDRHIMNSVYAVNDPQSDELLGTAIFAVDITERKRAEEALERERYLLRTLIDNLPDYIYFKDTASRFLLANCTTAQIMGAAAPEDLIGKTDFDFYPPDLAAQYYADEQEVIQSGRAQVNREEALIDPAGRKGWMLTTQVPLRDSQGTIWGLVGIGRDISDRKRIEKALQESQDMLRAQYQGIPVPTYTWQRIGEGLRLVDYNQAAAAITNGKIAEFMGVEVRELYRDQPEVAADIWRAFADQITFAREMSYRYTSTGESRYLAVKYAFAPPDLVLVHTEDITARKQAEDLLRIQLDLAIALSVTSDFTQTFQHFLAASVQIEGIDCGGVYLADSQTGELNLVCHLGLTPQFIAEVSHYYAGARETRLVLPGQPIYREFADLQARPNKTFQTEGLRALAALPVQYEGQTVAVLNLASHTQENISAHTRHALETIAAQLGHVVARVRAETALRESEEKFKLLAEESPNMIFINAMGPLVYVNKRCAAIMGYPREEFYAVDFDFLCLIAPESVDLVRSNYLKQTQGLEIAPAEITLLTKSGQRLDVILTPKLIPYANKPAILGLMTDIAARKQAEAQLRQAKDAAEAANRAKSLFLTHMSHELRTPLNVMLGYTQIFLRDRNLTEKQQDDIEIIHRSGEHLLTLINDLLDLAKIEAGKLELRATPFHLRNLLDTVVAMLRPRAEQKGLSLSAEFAADLPQTLVGDAQRLRQVVLNLLSNAIRFTERGRVTFRVRRQRLSNGPTPSPSPDRGRYFPGETEHSPPGRGQGWVAEFEDRSDTVTHPQPLPGGELTVMPRPRPAPVSIPYQEGNKGGGSSPEGISNAEALTPNIRFEVEDTGVGIAPNDLERIFWPFEQVGETRYYSEGVGLGLTISRKLVQMMGSDLGVVSAPGQGSRFWFDLVAPASVLSDVAEEPADLVGVAREPAPAQSVEPTIIPPPAELAALTDYAKIGDIRGIREWAAAREAGEPQLRPFVKIVKQFAKEMNIRAIQRLLQQYIQEKEP